MVTASSRPGQLKRERAPASFLGFWLEADRGGWRTQTESRTVFHQPAVASSIEGRQIIQLVTII